MIKISDLTFTKLLSSSIIKIVTMTIQPLEATAIYVDLITNRDFLTGVVFDWRNIE